MDICCFILLPLVLMWCAYLLSSSCFTLEIVIEMFITILLRNLKVLEKCTKNLIGHSRLAFNNHESNIDC